MQRARAPDLEFYSFSGNKIVNCIVKNVADQNYNSSRSTLEEMFVMEHCDTWDSWLPNGEAAPGTGNLSVDPQLDGDMVPGNEALKAGASMDGVAYDLHGVERGNPPTIGVSEVHQPSS